MNEKTSLPRRPARERLLAAADELFYQEGVQSVGIDKVVERAGVAKASLYSNFKGKDDLVRAYLKARDEARRATIETKLALHDAPRDRLLSVFDAMAESLAKPGYRGCAFLRATAEMPADAVGRQVCLDARRWTRELLSRLAKEAAAVNPDALASSCCCSMTGLRPPRRWIETLPPRPGQRQPRRSSSTPPARSTRNHTPVLRCPAWATPTLQQPLPSSVLESFSGLTLKFSKGPTMPR